MAFRKQVVQLFLICNFVTQVNINYLRNHEYENKKNIFSNSNSHFICFCGMRSICPDQI